LTGSAGEAAHLAPAIIRALTVTIFLPSPARRLARLVVGPIEGDGVITIAVRNALRFTFDRSAAPAHLQDGATFVVDGRRLSLPSSARSSSSHHGSQGVTFYRPHRSAPWKVTAEAATTLDPVRRYGPLISILLSSGPLVLIVPTHAAQHERVARRIAHDAWVYGRLDARIVTDEQLKAELGNDRRRDSLHGSWVVIGGKENAMAGLLQSTPRAPARCFRVTRQKADAPICGTRSAFSWSGTNQRQDRRRRGEDVRPNQQSLNRHPGSPSAPAQRRRARPRARRDRRERPRARLPHLSRPQYVNAVVLLACPLAASTDSTYALAAGTPSLDWMIVGHEADWKGAGGLLGAGWWNNAWGWEESGSWLS
jgi:hypothetical protein